MLTDYGDKLSTRYTKPIMSALCTHYRTPCLSSCVLPRSFPLDILSLSVNVDIFASMNFRGFEKLGNFIHVDLDKGFQDCSSHITSIRSYFQVEHIFADFLKM